MATGARAIATEPPRRWTDLTDPAGGPAAPGLPAADAAIAKALEKRFGDGKRGAPHDMAHQRAEAPPAGAGALAGAGGAHRAAAAAVALSGAARSAPNEVLEPHTLPPGTGPDMGETTPMQDFCGSASASWALVSGNLSQCFIHTVLFAAVDICFIVVAVMRLRDLLALPRPPPRALTRRQALKVGGASLVAVYNLIMFAAHLAYDYGADYQWLMYPMSCLTWSLCVVVVVLEVRYGWPTNWVCKAFWVGSGVTATVLLWSNLHDEKFLASHDMWVFLGHYLLYVAMALLALFLREGADYASLNIDISDISLDDDQQGMSEDESEAHKGAHARAAAMARGAGEADTTHRRLLAQIGELVSDDRWLAAAALVCCFIGAPIQVVQFIYAGMVIDDCAVPEGPSALVQYMAVLVALYLIEAVAAASQLILTTIVSERLGLRLRRAAFQAAVNQEVLYIEHNRVDQVTAVIQRHVQRVQACMVARHSAHLTKQDAVTVQVCQLVHAMIQSLVGLVFLVVLSWKLTLVALAIAPVIALLMLVQATVVQSYSRRVVEALEGVGAAALEILSAVRLIRSFSKEAAEKARFGSHVLSAYQVAKRMAVANGAAEGVGILVLKLCLVLSIFYGASLVHHNDISGGILVSYAFIAMQVIMALTVLAPVLADISNALHSANKVVELMQREPAINTKGGLTLPRSDGKLELNNVTLVLPHADVPRLSRVSLQVEAGTHVAVFGPAGSGKTVLLSLLVRFFEPVEGLVLLDDTDISTYEPAWLQSQIGLVAQEPVIFAASVADNMSLGTHASQTQLEQIAVALNLHADILRLPEGYQSNLAGPGVAALLSPSVRRRIAIARVLAKDAPILLLDDPGQEMEAGERQELFRVLEGAMAGRTVISVAQRPSVLHRSAAMVGVLHAGVLAEWGAPAALAARSSLYCSMLQDSPQEEAHGLHSGQLQGAAGAGAAGAAGGGGVGGVGGDNRSRQQHRIGQLMDAFEDKLARSAASKGPALETLGALVADMRATAR